MDQMNPHGVASGQTWVSCDKRDDGRTVTILGVDLGTGRAQVQRGPVKTQVRLDRFDGRSSGYRPA